MLELTGKQKRFLKGLGHHLSPVVIVGKDGLTRAVTASIEEALSAHELVKVKILENCPVDRRDAADQLASVSGAALVQVLGRTLLLFRPGDPPDISLP